MTEAQNRPQESWPSSWRAIPHDSTRGHELTCGSYLPFRVSSLPARTILVVSLKPPSDAARAMPGWSLLDAEERKRAAAFQFAPDRAAYIAAHTLARCMLADATGEPGTAFRFAASRTGKPALAPPFDRTGLHVSLSHTRGYVACGLAHQPLGVDVELLPNPLRLETVEAALSPSERAHLQSVLPDDRERYFARLWTVKEAVLKATGEGLIHSPTALTFDVTGERSRLIDDANGDLHRHDWLLHDAALDKCAHLGVASIAGKTTHVIHYHLEENYTLSGRSLPNPFPASSLD